MKPTKVYFFAFFISLFFLIVIVKLITLQITSREEILKHIKNQYYTKDDVILPRGTIFDRNKEILALSVPTITVFVLPQYIGDLKVKGKIIKTAEERKKELAKLLSPVLKKSQNWILKKLNSKGYVVLAKNLGKDYQPIIESIRRETKIWNLGIIENTKRFYPLGKIAGNTIGYVNKYDGQGKAGIERKYNEILGGGVGHILLMKDARGFPITIVDEEKKPKKDLITTIDKNIQFIAEEALKKVVKIRKPKEALILIVDPNNGEILANATYPNYDPNKYWKYRSHKNITFHTPYEIGSLAKPFVVARAVATGKVKKNEIIYGEQGKIYVDNVRIKDHKKFGWLGVKDVIIHSSNVGVIKIALRFKPDEFYAIFKNLGFGKSTGTFPGESKGILREDPRPVQIAYASIGQSWTATPIQVAMAYSAIANGGYLLKPKLALGYIDEQGKLIKEKNKIIRKALTDKEVKWLKDTLKLVVEKGTAKKGKSKFYTIAGKTGTAQKYDPKIKALSNEKFYTWFAGFFPVDKPKYTVVIFLNEPKKLKKWEFIGGGTVAAPVLKDIVDRLMYYSKEKPDKK